MKALHVRSGAERSGAGQERSACYLERSGAGWSGAVTKEFYQGKITLWEHSGRFDHFVTKRKIKIFYQTKLPRYFASTCLGNWSVLGKDPLKMLLGKNLWDHIVLPRQNDAKYLSNSFQKKILTFSLVTWWVNHPECSYHVNFPW